MPHIVWLLALGVRLGAGEPGVGEPKSRARAAADRRVPEGDLQGRLLLLGEDFPEWDSVTNTVVYLRGDELDSFPPSGASGATVLDQRDYAFVPHVLAVMARTPLTIANSDTIVHNIHTYSKGRRRNPPFNRAQRPKTTMTAVFRRPDSLLVLCDIHSHMEAHILVLSNPFYTMAAGDGTFAIGGIPPGKYELIARHKYYAARREVEIVEARTTRVSVEMAAVP